MERKGFIYLTYPNHNPFREAKAGIQAGQEPETDSDADTRDVCCLLASTSHIVQSAFLKSSVPYYRGSATHNGTSRLQAHLNHKLRKCPTGLPTALYYGGNFSTDDLR